MGRGPAKRARDIGRAVRHFRSNGGRIPSPPGLEAAGKDSNPGYLTCRVGAGSVFGRCSVPHGVLCSWVPSNLLQLPGGEDSGSMGSSSLLCGYSQMLDDVGLVDQVV